MQNVRLIRIEYWVEKAEAGIHFKDNVVHTDNQIRRARCWFPCMDDSSQRCWYEQFDCMTMHVCGGVFLVILAISKFITVFIDCGFVLHIQL